MSDQDPDELPGICAAYREPTADVLIFDAATQVMSEELAGFLAGWLGLAPGDYTPDELRTAAAVMVDRLGLREGAQRFYTRLVISTLGLR